jgi:hypothetical protein
MGICKINDKSKTCNFADIDIFFILQQNMSTKNIFLLAALSLFILAACKNNNSSGPYSMNWMQSGTSYSATSDYVTSFTDSLITNSITVQGQTTNATMSFYIFNYKRDTGTFPFKFSSVNDTVNTATALYLVTGAASRNALYGTLTITSVTSTLIKGTFSFTCTDSTTNITNGTFTCKAL